MKYKIYFGIIDLVRTAGWLVMGALLAEYYDIKIASLVRTVVLYVQG